MSLLQIRELLSYHGSFLSGVILDVDGQPIDPAQLVFDASQTYGINPQLLIVRMQVEQSAVTKKVRLPDNQLYVLTGYGAGSPMRNQIAAAAIALRGYFDAQLLPGGHTIGGWRVGEPHLTGNTDRKRKDPPEGLSVTPATMAAAALYTYTPYRGYAWGGNADVGGNALLVKTLRRDLKLHALMPWVTDHELYDEQGNVTFRFLTPNPETGEYTFTWSYDLPYLYNTWTWFDGLISGVVGYLPGQSTYSVKVGWDLLSYDYCKRDTDPGYPLDYNFYNGDCFVAAIADQPYDQLRWSWPPNEITFYPYSANITAHPGFVSLEGRVDKPPNEGPYQGRQYEPRASTVERSVPGSPAEGRILSVVQDSEYRPELPSFPSWGTVTITIK